MLILIFIGLFHKVVLCTFTTLVVYYCLIDTSVKAAWCTFELEELVQWKQSQLRTIRINFRVAILEALAAYSFCAFMNFTFWFGCFDFGNIWRVEFFERLLRQRCNAVAFCVVFFSPQLTHTVTKERNDRNNLYTYYLYDGKTHNVLFVNNIYSILMSNTPQDCARAWSWAKILR